MAIPLAVLATLSIAIGEFFAADMTKRGRPAEVTTTMFAMGFAMTAVLAAIWPGTPSRSDLLFGAAAGTANGIGIVLLYLAYSRGSLRSAAPAAAVVMSSVPVVWDVVVSGTRPSTLSWIGLVLGVIAIALSSHEPASTENGPEDHALGLAIAAGLVFGLLFVLLDEIGPDAGASPLVVQRSVSLVIAVVVARATGPRVFPADRGVFRGSLLVGVFATTALTLMFVALQSEGSLSIVGVIGSQYAGVAVLLGLIFRGQRMWWWQGLGLAAASIALALIALG